MSAEYIILAIGGVLAIIGYLLQQKDASQQASINLLFQKHDADVKELEALKLQIASQHYVKGELDARFDKLEGAFREGFTSLGTKFDRLGDVLLTHIQNEEIRK